VSTLCVEAFGRNYRDEPELAGERGPDVHLQAVSHMVREIRNMRAWVSQPKQASVSNRPGTSTVKQTRWHNLRVILNLNPLDGKPCFNRFDQTRSWFHDSIMAGLEMCSASVRVTAFERGANDYVCVLFSIREFAAPIAALLQRATRPSIRRYLTVGGLQIDQAARSTLLNGKVLELTSKEFDILVRLAQNPGVVVSAEALPSQVWGPGLVHHNQSLRLHISNLRKKAGSASADFIRSIPSNAYVTALQQSARPQGWTFLPCSLRQCGPTCVRGGMTSPMRPL
jgi:DNA-binding response OmpR family regulator